MYQRKIERNALAMTVACFVLFAVSVAIAPALDSAMKWLGPLSTGLTTLSWGFIYRDRRRARIAAEFRTSAAMPVPTSRDAGVAP